MSLTESKTNARTLGAWQICAALALLLFIPWLGQRSLWFPDEPDVAEPAMSMYQSGDWVVPRHNDEPWIDYPPMVYWLGATSSHLLGGPTAFALRLPVALIGVLLVAGSARFTQRTVGGQAGLWAGLTLMTAPFFVYQAISYHPDMLFAGCIAAGLVAYAIGSEHEGWRSYAWMSAGFACFGGAVLSKGPLGLLLPAAILVAWNASLRRWSQLLWLVPLVLVTLAVALPWYLRLAQETSSSYVSSELYLQNFARFGAADRGHWQPWWYYLERVWLDWGPWSLLLPGAVFEACRRSWHRPVVRLALLWLAVSLVFLSAAATKREVYLLPAYPAVAFLLGWRLDAMLRSGSKRDWFPLTVGVAALVGALTLLVTAGYAAGLDTPAPTRTLDAIADLLIPLLVLSTVLAVGGGVILTLARKGRSMPAHLGVVGLLWLTYATSLAAVLPRVDADKSYRSAAVSLRQSSGSLPIGYYPHGIESKRAGFRVEDPAFVPLRMLATPSEVAGYLVETSGSVILDPARAQDIYQAVGDRVSLRQRHFELGSRRFLVLARASLAPGTNSGRATP